MRIVGESQHRGGAGGRSAGAVAAAALAVAAAVTALACGAVLDLGPDGPIDGGGGGGGEASTSGGPDAGDVRCGLVIASLVDFGDMLTATKASLPVKVTNAGTELATVNAAVDTDTGFAVTPSTLDVGAFASGDLRIDVATRSTAGEQTATLTLSAGTCKAAVKLRANVIAGDRAVGPSPLVFPDTPCGVAPAPAALSIMTRNKGNTTWSGSSTGPFSIPSSGTVEGNATTQIPVSANPMPMGRPLPLAGALTLSLDDEKALPPRSIPVTIQPVGAYITFGSAAVTNGGTLQVTNSGNASAKILLSAGGYDLFPSLLTLGAGQTQAVTVTSPAVAPGEANVTVSSAGSGVLCGADLAKIAKP